MQEDEAEKKPPRMRFNRLFHKAPGYSRLPDQESDPDSGTQIQLSKSDVNHCIEVKEDVQIEGSSEMPEKSDEGESPTAPLEGQVEVTLCQVGQPRRKVAVDPLWSVRELKENLFPEEVENKKLIRVIFSGKRLKDPDFLKDFGVKEGVFIHISITDAIDPENAQNVRFANQTDNWENDQLEADARFARILDQGFSFNNLNENLGDRPQNARRDNAEFLWGFVLGSILGIFMLIWVMQPNVPKTMKFGIMCGIALHIYVDYSQIDH